MAKTADFFFYVAAGAGFAITSSSFTMMSALTAMGPRSWIVPAIAAAGLLCLAISASIGELASLYPSAPGIRTYIRAALGNRVSLFSVYLYMGALIMVAGVESFVFALILKPISAGLPMAAVVLAVLALATVVNLTGKEMPRRLQTAATVLLVIGMIGLGLMGLGHPAAPGAAKGAPSTWLAMVGMSIFFYMGFEWVTPMGRGPGDYKRLIPVSMLAALAVIGLANGAFMAGLNRLFPAADLSADAIPHARYAMGLFGEPGKWVALGLSLLASLSTFNVGLMGGSRFIYALAREGNLPRWCASVSYRTGVPVGAVLAMSAGIAASSLIVLGTRTEMIASALGASILCLIYAALMYSLLRLRKSGAAARASFRSPVPAWMQWGFVAALPAFGLATLLSQGAKAGACAALAAGIALAGSAWSARRTAAKAPAHAPEMIAKQVQH